MSYDFSLHRTRILELIDGDGLDGAGLNEFVKSCIDAGHRQHFFVPSGTALHKRGQTLFNVVEKASLVGQRAKPGKPHWQAFCEGRPLTLSAILKIDSALTAISQHPDQKIQENIFVGERGTTNFKAFGLEPRSVVPSIFYIEPHELREYRSSQAFSLSREKLSVELFGNGRRYTLGALERGGDDDHFRVTSATRNRMADILGDDLLDLFTDNAQAGIRKGENAKALPVSHGNLMSYVRNPMKVASKSGDQPTSRTA